MSSEDPGWYVSREGQQFGPFSIDDLGRLRSSGKLTSRDLLWRQGWPQWVPVAIALDQTSTSAPRTDTDDKIAIGSEPSISKRAEKRTVVTPLTLATIGLLGALGGGVLSNLEYFIPPRPVANVDHCDKSLSNAEPVGEYSGIYTGLVWDKSGEKEVQLKLVRNNNTVQGSYFRHGTCGSIYGEIVDSKMIFIWHWAGSSGRGVAGQEGTKLIAVSGFGEATQGGGTLVFYQREPN